MVWSDSVFVTFSSPVLYLCRIVPIVPEDLEDLQDLEGYPAARLTRISGYLQFRRIFKKVTCTWKTISYKKKHKIPGYPVVYSSGRSAGSGELGELGELGGLGGFSRCLEDTRYIIQFHSVSFSIIPYYSDLT